MNEEQLFTLATSAVLPGWLLVVVAPRWAYTLVGVLLLAQALAGRPLLAL